MDGEEKRQMAVLEQLEVEKREATVKEHRLLTVEEKEQDEGPLGEGMELSEEEEKMVDERVESILHPKDEVNQEKGKKESPGNDDEPDSMGQDAESEEKDLLEAAMEEEQEDNKTKNRK